MVTISSWLNPWYRGGVIAAGFIVSLLLFNSAASTIEQSPFDRMPKPILALALAVLPSSRLVFDPWDAEALLWDRGYYVACDDFTLEGGARVLLLGCWPAQMGGIPDGDFILACLNVTLAPLIVYCVFRLGSRRGAERAFRDRCWPVLSIGLPVWVAVGGPVFHASRLLLARFWTNMNPGLVGGLTVWVDPRAAYPSATVFLGLVLAIGLAWVLRYRMRGTEFEMGRYGPRRVCYQCGYKVGTAAACSECGAAHPQRNLEFHCTPIGSWFAQSPRRRFVRRTLSFTLCLVFLFGPMLVGCARVFCHHLL